MLINPHHIPKHSMTLADNFVQFINKAPSPFHAVEEIRQLLLSQGYTELFERDSWTLKPLGKYFFTRNKSALVAFALGGQWNQNNQGFSIVGAHTDSPCLKVKPISKKEKLGWLQVGVQLYGGGIWHTWFDRDLSLAGRVLVQNKDKIESKLVKIDKPILRIPTLAIHLDRTANEAFKFNTETQLTPVLATALKAYGEKVGDKGSDKEEEKHHKILLNLLAKELKCQATDIQDFELCLYDTQPSVIGGICDEFIFSPRLDNLMMSWCGTKAFINANQHASFQTDSNARVLALFDNEEVGSLSAYGADSHLIEAALRRISVNSGAGGASTFEEAIQRSFLISADMAHALHPNYADKHEDNHRPMMHKGVVIKTNANQRYASTSVTSTVIRQLAKKKNVPIQEFVVRNDSPCGSTIGPILSGKLGLRTVDVGNPQLSMHSCREMAATDDVANAVGLLEEFYESFVEVDNSIN